MGLWQQIFLHFGADDFPFQISFTKCFKIIVFPLSRRAPVLELQICVAALRTSIAFCNSVSADRSGMAASRFLAAATAGSIFFSILTHPV